MGCLLKIVFLAYIQLLLNCSSTEYKSLGCYFLNFSLETSGLLSRRDPLLTYQRCFTNCRRHLQSYFLVYDKYCVCSQSITNYTRLEPGSYCDIPCPGAKRESCGGSSAVNIFSVTYCNILSKPADGLVEQSTEEAMFACLRGYQLQGAQIIHCNKTLLEWDGPTQPLCVKENKTFISPIGSVILVVTVVLLAIILFTRELCHRRRNNIRRINIPCTDQSADPDNTIQLYGVTRKTRYPEMDANPTLGKTESKMTEEHIRDLNNDTISVSSEPINNKRNIVMDRMAMEDTKENVTSPCYNMPAERKNSSGCQSVQSLQDDLVSITDDESDKSNENDFTNFLTHRKQMLKGTHKVQRSSIDLFCSSGSSEVDKQDQMDSMSDDEDNRDDDYPTMLSIRQSNEMDIEKRNDVDTYGIVVEGNTEV